MGRSTRSYTALPADANFLIDDDFVREYDAFISALAESIITLQDPQSFLEGFRVQIGNISEGWQSVVANDGFPDGSDVVLIPPGGTEWFQCRETDEDEYKWVRQGYDDPPKAGAWTPTEDWTTGTPTSETKARFRLTPKGLCHVDIEVIITDGAGATDVTFTPPPGCTPMKVDAKLPLFASQQVGTADPTYPLAFIDCADATPSSRLIGVYGLAEFTDDDPGVLRISGTYPVYGAETRTPTAAFSGGTPTSTSLIGLHQVEAGTCYDWVYQELSDGDDATGLTYTPAIPLADRDMYISGDSFVLVDATYSDGMAFVDATNASMESRLIGFKALPQLTDTKACIIAIAVQYEVHGGLAFSPEETFGTDPDSWASSLRYRVDKVRRIFEFEYYGTSADGNGNAANGLEIPLPVVPKYGTSKKVLSGLQLVDTTWKRPIPYIDHSQVEGIDRAVIRFEALAEMTDDVESTLYLAGFIEVD